MEQLSGLDTFFTLNEKRTSPMHIGALMLYDPVQSGRQPLRFDDVYQIFADNLNKTPIFRRKLLSLPYHVDKPYWIDDNSFDLDQHVEVCSAAELSLPQDLWQLVARLHANGLDMKRPLWRATFIDDIDSIPGYVKGTTGLYLQVHHAAIDGMSGAAILAAIHNLTDHSGPSTEERDAWQPERVSPRWWLAYKANNTRWVRGWRNASKTREIVHDVQRLREHVKARSPDQQGNKWSSSPFNSRITRHRNIAVLNLALDEIKAVRRTQPGTTVNHVALTIVGGALRHYLIAHEVQPTESLAAGVPIDIRNRESADGGNVLSITMTALRTDLENPRERLAAVRDAAIEAREKAAVLGETILLDLTSVLSPRTSASLLKLFSIVSRLPFKKSMPINTVVSNVPGSPVDLYLAGARMSNMHAFGLLMDGLGLFHTATSYKDRFSITALSCPECLPDIEFYQHCLERSWLELRGELGQQAGSARSAQARV